MYPIDTNAIINLIKKNISQLLTIALDTTDEHIELHYGGEEGLLALISGYVDLLAKYMRVV